MKTLILLFLGLSSFSASAAGPVPKKKLNFDEAGVVEGLNKRPLDSFSQISDADRRRNRPHLYRKRASFEPENAETLRQMRYNR
jgi:hypothetical protein